MKRRHFIKFGLLGITLANNARALEFYPKPSDKKYALLYSTWCGSSRDAAIWISEGMGGIADVFDVREQPDLKGFDHLIIGGSIRSMATSKDLQEYIKTNKTWLRDKVRGFFAVCGNMRNPVGPQQKGMFIDNHLAKLCEVNDINNIPSKVFLGRITKSLMKPEIAKMMEGLEDYDNLKRSDCLGFGKDILMHINKIEGE